MKPKRKILATAALVYANGPLHLGHLVEYIQADIWCRFQKLRGHQCVFISGSDAHGTPVMITAKAQGVSPETLITNIHKAQQQDLERFHVNLDNFYTTHSPENEALVHVFYNRFKEKNDVFSKSIEQAYDEHEKLFLPDRFVKGTCPYCQAPNQYGDSCEACGATYAPTDLKDPRSILSNTPPVRKTSLHYFFQLSRYENLLKQWIKNDNMQPEVSNKLSEWFSDTLKPWDISRDAPYFGFKIPDHPDQYFYVWLDAPIGYMASFKNLIEQNKADLPFGFEETWAPDSMVELYHFVGKDIIYFHGLFWPAILASADFRLPTALCAHGFLTINGQKMSKSKGTFITAHQFAKQINPDCLRYYIASKTNGRVEDINFDVDDFRQKVNTDLVGKIVNIASRCAGFIHQSFEGHLSDALDDEALFLSFVSAEDAIASHFEKRELSQVVRLISNLADQANQYINDKKPWAVAKTSPKDASIQSVCTMGLNLFRILTVFLKPIVPHLCDQAELFLKEPAPLTWDSIKTPALAKSIHEYTPLIYRVTEDQTNQLLKHETEKQ